MRFSPGMHLIALVATIFLCACSSSDDDSDDLPALGGLRAINALPDLGSTAIIVQWQDVDPSLGQILPFQETTSLVDFSNREYAFRFETVPPDGGDGVPIVETTGRVEEGVLYDVILAGKAADPRLFVWSQPRRDWAQVIADAEAGGDTVTTLDVTFGHAGADVGPVDVFLEAVGVDPVAATPRTTLAFGELQSPLSVEAGDYQLVLTPAGDPTTVLYRSRGLTLQAASTVTYALLDNAGAGTQNLTVLQLIGSGRLAIADIDATSMISVVHAVRDGGAVDIYAADDVTTPLISGLEFGQLSAQTMVPPATDLVVTPAGDTSVILVEVTGVPAGAFRRLFLARLPSDDSLSPLTWDMRMLVSEGRVRVFNGTERFTALDVYIIDPALDFTTSAPTYASVPFGAASGLDSTAPGQYDVIVTEAGTDNVVFGPAALTVEAGDTIEVVITDAAESTLADVIFFESDP